MTSILESIVTVPSSRIALADNNDSYRYNDLFALKASNQETLDFLNNTVVVIKGRERFEFALLLILLDGVAKKILFLPRDIDSSLHQKYYKEANVLYEITLNENVLTYSAVQIIDTEKICERQHLTEWIIPTSGTTSTPKLVAHTFESLTKSTKRDITLGEDYTWGLVFDIYRFSGIQVLLQSLLSGATLIITSPTQSMAEMLVLLSNNNCTALSATSSFWRKVLMTKESNTLNLRRITLGGEIADKNILEALNYKFKATKISHIYASTEVGVGFSVTDGKSGFPISYLHGTIDGTQMKIDGDGLLWIAPQNKNQRYLSTEKMYDEEGYINTGDLVEIKEDRVYFLGRDSGAINVGGNKVQPEEVETTLLSSGLLSEAYVYAMKNPMMGSLVCADVVLSNVELEKKEAKKILLTYCRDHLENFKVPAIVKFVTEIQTTQSGKLKRT